MRSSLVLPIVAALLGCQRTHEVTLSGGATVVKRYPVDRALDVLFVIDNSASTADKQTVFAANFPAFARALDAFPEGRPNLHVAVVSTTVDLGVDGFVPGCPHPTTSDDGRFQHAARVAGCTPPTGNYLVDVDTAGGGRTTNYAGTLDQALSCIAQLGADGCGFEAELEAMKRALDGTRPENAGFLRPDADLAVIILTDEDDCSVRDPQLFALDPHDVGPGDFRCQPLFAYDCDTAIAATAPGTYTGCRPRHGGYLHDPADYVAFLATLKDPSQTMVAVVAGEPTSTIHTGAITTPFDQGLALLPSCAATINGNFAIGRPALRLAEFVHAFGEHGRFASVCQADYAHVLADIGHAMFTMMGPCLEGDVAQVNRDPASPGVQVDCVVIERTRFGSADELDATVPPCAMLDATTTVPGGARPCYWVAPAPVACATTATNLALHIERAVVPPAGTVVDVVCATP